MFGNTKRLYLLLIPVMCALLLAACGGDKATVVDDTSAPATGYDVPVEPVAEPSSDGISETVPITDTKPVTVKPAVTAAVPAGTTAAPVDVTSPVTSVNEPTEVPTTEFTLKGKSLKEIQDTLFNTTDPNVAGQILTFAGFEYDAEQGIYYSSLNPLQRYFGFNLIYDIAAPRTGMVYDTKRIYFTYQDKDWMVQLWKGQYGITVGAEIGIYYKPSSRTIPHYDCVSDEDLVEMAFTLYKSGEYYFSRGPERHWWLTGFKLLDVAVPITLYMDITITLDSKRMANEFEKGLNDQILPNLTYTRDGNTFYMQWM